MSKLAQKTISDLMDERERVIAALKQSTIIMKRAGGFVTIVEENKTLLESMGLGLQSK